MDHVLRYGLWFEIWPMVWVMSYIIKTAICGQKVDYRQQVSILWPSAYKAITISHSDSLESKVVTDDVVDALPLSYTGITCLLGTTVFLVWFRSGTRGFELATLSLLLVRNCIWQLSHGARSLRTAWNTWCEMGIIRCKHNGCFWMTPHPERGRRRWRRRWRVAHRLKIGLSVEL